MGSKVLETVMSGVSFWNGIIPHLCTLQIIQSWTQSDDLSFPVYVLCSLFKKRWLQANIGNTAPGRQNEESDEGRAQALFADIQEVLACYDKEISESKLGMGVS